MTHYFNICKQKPCTDCTLNETYVNGRKICDLTTDEMRDALYVITEEESNRLSQEKIKNE